MGESSATDWGGGGGGGGGERSATGEGGERGGGGGGGGECRGGEAVHSPTNLCPGPARTLPANVETVTMVDLVYELAYWSAR